MKERSARMMGWIVRTSYPKVLPPIVGASTSGRSPAAFASLADGRYGCASAGGVPGGGRGPDAPAPVPPAVAPKGKGIKARRGSAVSHFPPAPDVLRRVSARV